MYCPKCATQNADDTKFCRACGVNLSLVPQALTGNLTSPQGKRRRRSGEGERADLSGGVSKTFMGLAFLVIAVGLWVTRMWWGIWMLIPAFALLGKGIGEIISSVSGGGSPSDSARMHMPPRVEELPRRSTGELYPPPPSVTEDTTRHLDPTKDRY